MKSYLLFAVIFAYSAKIFGNETSSKEEELKKLFGILKECSDQYPTVDKEILGGILAHKILPKNDNEKCLAGCILGKAGAFKDGKINVEGWKKVCHLRWSNYEVAEKAGGVAQFCYDEAQDDDECKLADKTLVCAFKRYNELDLPDPDAL